MNISDQVLNYLQEFSDWLEKYEKKLAKVEEKYELEKQSKGKVPSKDILQMMNMLRKKVDKIAKVVTKNKDLADNFCNRAEELVNDISKTLEAPKSLSKKELSGLQQLQHSVLKAILKVGKKLKEAFGVHSTKQEEAPPTLIQKAKGFKNMPAKPHYQNIPQNRKGARQHSFTRSGK